MRRPDVRRAELYGTPADGFGIVIGAAFFEPEGMHAENDATLRIAVAPGVQHLGGAVAEHRGMTQQEIEQVGDLQRQQVAREFRGDVAVQLGRPGEVTAQPGACGVQMHALALQRVTDVTLSRPERRGDAGLGAPLTGRGEQPCLEAMPHDEAGSMVKASSMVAMGSVR